MRDRPVRIAVLVVGDEVERPVEVAGPLRTAVRTAFAHPRLAAPLRTLQMDADQLVGRIVSRWENPAHERDAKQSWVKSDGTTTARWWINRDDLLSSPRPPGG